MDTCRFLDLMQALKPWLNEDYVQHARLNESGDFTLTFVNGGQQNYRIDSCTVAQLRDALELLSENDVQIFQ